MHLYTVELYQRRHFRMKPDIQAANGSEFVVIGTVNDAAVRCDRETGPMLQVLARGKVNRRAARSAYTVRADAEDNGRTV